MDKSLIVIIISSLCGCSQYTVNDDEGFPYQYAQEIKKSSSFTKHFKGIEIKRYSSGVLSFDGKIALLEEHSSELSIYNSGEHTIVVYRSGKVVIMKNHQLLGYAK